MHSCTRLNPLPVLSWSQVYELSDQGEEFLRQQFSAYDLDGDGLLSWQQLDDLFSTIPPPVWQVRHDFCCI